MPVFGVELYFITKQAPKTFVVSQGQGVLIFPLSIIPVAHRRNLYCCQEKPDSLPGQIPLAPGNSHGAMHQTLESMIS